MTRLCIFGYGYIISNLLNELDISKYEVDIYSIENSPMIYNDNIKYFKINFTVNELEKLLKKNYDIHLNTVGRARGTYEELYESNVKVNELINNCIEKYATNKKTIFFSTSAVYGDKDSKIKESDLLCQNSDYAKTKIYIENYILNNASKCLILRPFNIYGNTKNINIKSIPCVNFITALEKDEALTFFTKNGNFLKRDIVSIKYLANVLNNIITNNRIKKTEIINLGTGIVTDYKTLKRDQDTIIENNDIFVSVISDMTLLNKFIKENNDKKNIH